MKPRISPLVPATSMVLYSLLAATTALGQVTPDNTLGNESSVVTPNVTINGALADLIEGGAIRDSNLFHSFSDFNVGEFGRVYFANPAGVANILSRVTGGNVSNILGTLGVLGNANLFVINPNGIVFGPNSRLDVGGSFFGSTADSVLFEDGTVFSTKNPNGKPLLTINIPSGLQFGSNPGTITNQSFFGLQVPNGQTLGLIGGEVTIPNGALFAFDGRIELGGVGSNGVVNLTPTDTSFVLDYSAVQGFQDISLSEGAVLDTSGEGGGSIQIQGANVSLRDRSDVFANTRGSGSGGGIVVKASQFSLEDGSRITTDVLGSGQGGDLTVNASESVGVIGVSANGTLSLLGARVFPGVTGNGGDVSITTGTLMVSDGARVSVNTVGEGDGGDLTVNANSSVQVIGTTADISYPSGLFARTFWTGNAGDLNITTGKLIVSDGASVSASTSGEGNGGNLSVDASSTVEVIGTTADGNFPSALSTQTNPRSTGNAGNLSITTGQLIVSDGAVVSVNTFGEGDGGNLSVNASSTVQVIGTSADGLFSGLFARTERKGNGGDVSITTGELMVSDGAVVSADTFGEGNGGNLSVNASSSVQLIGTSADGEFRSALSAGTEGKGNGGDVSITTGELTVSEGAVVSVSTFGEGDSGNLSVNASSTVKLSSDLFAQANRGSKGNAGNLSITTRQLIVKDGAQVSTGTFGEGDSGDLTVNASSTVQLIGTGTSADGQFASGLFTRTLGIGNAGELNITTGQLMVSEGAVVSASTFGEGDGGDLTVNANSTVKVIGTSADGRLVSGLSTQANSRATGNAGDLTIATGELIVSDGAQVSAGTSGEGDGGDLTVNASSTVQLSSDLSTQTQGTGNAGDLTIATGELIVSDGAQVSASTLGEGDGGDLTVNASESVQLIGTGTSADGEFASGLFIRANREATGNAGKFLNITTDKLIISDGAEVSARSFEERTSAGEVKINANSIFLDNNARITAQTAAGENSNIDNSNIKLFSRDIRLLNRSLILTDAKDTTTGGNITINTDTLVGLGNSDITANADKGEGGRVEINAKGIFGLEFRDSPTPDNDITSTSNLGSSSNGDVILNISQVDPTSGLNELPGILVDAEAILANDLCGFENDRIAGGSSFTITGKGGLPPTPEDPVINAHRTVRWRTRPRLGNTRQPLQAQASVKPRQDKKVIIEAQGWVVAKDGTIILTAQPFQGTPVEQIFPNLDCHVGRGNRE